jgi:tRNA threonylcarbamoyladenosine biosynthesis protein TsaB
MPSSNAPGTDRRAPVVLAFDTAGSACSVAIGRGSVILARQRLEMRHGHAEALLPMIDSTMSMANLIPGDIDVVAVSVGPGGFTGIRAGIAAAQGLALATQARLVGVTCFAAVAARLPKGDEPTLVALDSRREDLYVQIFSGTGDPLTDPATVMHEEISRLVVEKIGDAPMRIAGDAVEGAAASLAGRDRLTIIDGSVPDALGVLTVAGYGEFDTPPRPLYLRPPDVSFPKTRRGIGDVT